VDARPGRVALLFPFEPLEAAPGEIDFDDRDRDCRTGLGRRDVVKADAAIRLRSA